MKKAFKIGGTLIVATLIGALLLMRYVVMPNEGYPTWKAVRNILIRDGEIRIEFPNGVTPIAAECDHPDGKTTIDGNQVITKIGYSWCTITVRAKTKDGEERIYRFNPQKLNHWNRIRYLPRDEEDPEKGFRKFENGVEKEPHDVVIKFLR